MTHQSSHQESLAIDPSESGVVHLIAACRDGDETTVTALLRKNVPIAAGPSGFEPLHYAVREGHTAIVKKLLEYGANPHSVIENIWGHHLSTRDLAKARGFVEVVALIENAIRA